MNFRLCFSFSDGFQKSLWLLFLIKLVSVAVHEVLHYYVKRHRSFRHLRVPAPTYPLPKARFLSSIYYGFIDITATVASLLVIFNVHSESWLFLNEASSFRTNRVIDLAFLVMNWCSPMDVNSTLESMLDNFYSLVARFNLVERPLFECLKRITSFCGGAFCSRVEKGNSF